MKRTFYKRFENKDGQTISLDRKTWVHICEGHPHMGQHLEDVRRTLADPSVVHECKWDKKVHLYYRLYARILVGKTVCRKAYVLVVVDTRDNSVKTAHIISRIKEGGRILWLK